MIREYYDLLLEDEKDGPDLRRLVARTYELCEFIVDVLGIETWEGDFPIRSASIKAATGSAVSGWERRASWPYPDGQARSRSSWGRSAGWSSSR